MRLIIKDKETQQETEGILIKKDASFLFLRIGKQLKSWHWSSILEIFRIYKEKRVNVNIESLRKGRD
jgi:hypothetical protein